MRPLHRRLLEIERAAIGEVEPRPETPERIAAAEARLGRPLPPGYRAFLEEVGSVSWPVQIGNVIAFDLEDAPWPAHFVPFADDGGGNLWGFDLRGKKGRELPIDYWDHEEPELSDDPGPPDKFEAWLAERIEGEKDDLLEKRRRAIAERLAPVTGDTYAPDRAQVQAIEEKLGRCLPDDYVWFTTTFGTVRWPVWIGDVLELGMLTLSLKIDWPKDLPEGTVAFAQESEGRFAAFDKHGAVRGFGLRRPAPRTFLDYVEDRLDHAPPLPSPEQDEDLVLARRLLRALRDGGHMETTPGFDPEPVARDLANLWTNPERILDMLMDRDDVIEIYLSERELIELQGTLYTPPIRR